MARIALKVDVDTLRGTRSGVPRLMAEFDRVGVRATFLFSLGPDHTGWALRRVFRPGFLSKVSRTSVIAHYGVRTLLYGTLLPAPDIGRAAVVPMQAAQRAAHECGIHAWDHVLWQDNVRDRDEAWTRRQMKLAFDRYGEVFGARPDTHGAAGWQMNQAAFLQLDDWGLTHSSDGRGPCAYVPTLGARRLAHVQLPTSLPTLDELIGTDGVDEHNVAAALLRLTDSDQDQVFTLHAELEGGALAPALQTLLDGWKAQGHQLGSVGDQYRALQAARLPQQPIEWGSVAGRSGSLVVSRAAGASQADAA